MRQVVLHLTVENRVSVRGSRRVKDLPHPDRVKYRERLLGISTTKYSPMKPSQDSLDKKDICSNHKYGIKSGDNYMYHSPKVLRRKVREKEQMRRKDGRETQLQSRRQISYDLCDSSMERETETVLAPKEKTQQKLTSYFSKL